MIFASDFGFRPGNDARENSAALQRAFDRGGCITVDGRGIADLSEPVFLSSDTTVTFENGLYLRRQCSDTPHNNGYVFSNRGAFTGERDRHIRLYGLRILTNGVECHSGAVQTEKTVPGLNGVISFFHIDGLIVSDFEIMDLPPENFAIHVCDFDDIVLENLHIEGRKDAVHLGRGSKFVIRHGVFRTFDDPIALNAHDYSGSNPQLGWITDGIVEDCYDLDDTETTGFFARILAGSWCDWKKGMQVQHSDTVVCNHRVYRVYMHPDGTVYTSNTPPTHEKGTEVYDGIAWVMVEEGDIYSCGCRNVVFRDIHLQKKRPYAFSFHFDMDNWSRSVYPGSVMPLQTGITFENIDMQAEIPYFIISRTPVDQLRITRSRLIGTQILLFGVGIPGAEYETTEIVFDGCTFDGGDTPLVRIADNRSTTVRAYASSVRDGYVPTAEGNAAILENDIGLIAKP